MIASTLIEPWNRSPRRRRRGGLSSLLAVALALAATVAVFGQDRSPVGDRGLKIGLYKDGELIEVLSDLAPAQAVPSAIARSEDPQPMALDAGEPVAAAPGISTETQARNQAFGRTAALGLEIQRLLETMLEPPTGPVPMAAGDPRDDLTLKLQAFLEAAGDARSALDATWQRIAELELDPVVADRHADTVESFEQNLQQFTGLVFDAVAGGPEAARAVLEFLNDAPIAREPSLEKVGPTVQLQVLPAPELNRETADALEARAVAPPRRVAPPRPSQRAAPTRGTPDAAPRRPGAAPRTEPAISSTASADSALQPMEFGGAGDPLEGPFPQPFDDPPGSADLEPTIDVQITQAIIDKAAALGNSPLAIYEFVRNNVQFQPYLGSRKGAAFTLQQLAGNDTDQASLLLALLRAAGVPSRYVRGSVEMTPEQAMNWLGVDDARTAGSILTTAGLDGLNIVDGAGNVTAVRCTRVWVEAYIPYSNYRGIPNDDTGKTWIPLDPAYTGTRITPGEDVLALMGWDADAFLADYISTFHDPSPIEKLLEDVQAWLDINRPGQTVADIERTIALDELELGLLPASLPYQARSITSRFATLEDAKRYKVRFHLRNGGTTLIDHTVPLLHLVGHRLTIEYVGATPTDQAIIDSYGSIYETPPNLVQVKPLLKLDDIPIATSVNSIGMGRTHNSDMHFLHPTGASNVQPLVSNDIIAGNGQAIAFDSFLDVHDFLLAPPDTTRGNYFEELMYESAVDYLGLVNDGQRQAERLLRLVSVQDVSEAIVENSIKVTTSFGVPVTFEWTGLIVDADRRIVGPFPVDGNDTKTIPYMKLTGYDGSFMEHRIFEDNFESPAVSTIRAFHVSVQQGIPLCTITSSIGAQCPGFSHSPAVTAAVNDALARGNIIIIPRTSITYEQWVGTGYIDMDPTTGAAGYMISGGINGNTTVSGGAIVDWLWPIFPPCLAWPWNVEVEIIQPASDTPHTSAIFSGCDDSKIEFKFRVTATSCFFGGDPGPVERVRTTNLTKKRIADLYGGGDYVLTMSSLFSTPVTNRFTIVKPNLVVQGLREEIWPPPNELNPGAFIRLNDNDDNNNGIPDKDEFGPVPGEKDLIPFNLFPGVGSLTTGTLTLQATPQLRVFEGPDKSGPVLGASLQRVWSPPSTMPTTLYLEGKAASSALRDASLTLRYQSGSIDCQDTAKVSVIKIDLITPSGDPVAAPVSAGDGQNEFTFSTANPGVLTMNLKARVTPSGAANEIKDHVLFVVDTIGASTMKWSVPNPGGKPTASGGDLVATVTFTGLPANNSDFGGKKAAVYFSGNKQIEKRYEVFFPRDSSNNTGNDPNWFYYWNQIAGVAHLEYAGNSGSSKMAEVPGMTQWSYSSVPNKRRILIYDEVVTRASPYGVGKEMSGIDMFVGTAIHENQHIVQIANADALLPTSGSDSFRYGWSWNVSPHNHWQKGPDGEWGIAGVDDDGNGVIDDARAVPPFEPGNGDDVSLDHPSYIWWPASWPLPNPNNAWHPIESDAVNATDNAMNEHDYALQDWANPGKQHSTLNRWDD